ncbi:MAG: divalent cation tolerance protein CutA [Planctomycetaceae bacterium]|nr:divalent cation tolerance protein CutA [Planctomycetaceae bacterium]
MTRPTSTRPEAPLDPPTDGDAPRIVLVTCPDMGTAEGLARTLVDARLAACVQIQPGLVSVYRWRGAVERADEVALVAKTVVHRVAAVEAHIAASHPYEVPEILVLAPASAGAAYAAWLAAECAPTAPPAP